MKKLTASIAKAINDEIQHAVEEATQEAVDNRT